MRSSLLFSLALMLVGCQEIGAPPLEAPDLAPQEGCAGLTACAGVCVNLRDDPRNCNACGNLCPPETELCVSGSCATACGGGNRRCGNRCVNTQSDAQHCGRCDQACLNNKECRGGTCQCPIGQSECEGECYNLQTDPKHCGHCATACADKQVCNQGKCENNCGQGFTNCGGGFCVNLQTDPKHCGRCGQECLPGAECNAGQCRGPSCEDKAKNGTETDVDCGGGTCPKCTDGKVCVGNADCNSGNCQQGRCSPLPMPPDISVSPRDMSMPDLVMPDLVRDPCANGIKDGQETDTDCGRGCPAKCALGKGCKVTADCQPRLLCDTGKSLACVKELGFVPIGLKLGDANYNFGSLASTVNCLQACALQFGGAPNNYFCGTKSGAVDHLAYYDCCADASHCAGPNPVPFFEDLPSGFKYCPRNGNNCSAVVNDACSGQGKGNYCYQR